MPVPLTRTASPVPAVAAAPNRFAAAGWLREPLLHFLVLGAILFTVDHFIVAGRDDPNAIVVGTEVTTEARQLFQASRGREPNADELRALRERWIDNEVLYREGLAMGVDRGDKAIRERVIFKALSLVEATTKLPPFDEALLRAWFEKNRVKYDEPARFDFQEAVLSGDSSEAAVRAFVDTLNAGTPGELQAGLRVFKGRPLSNLAQSYGDDFAKVLADLPPGGWHALQTKDGWRAMRLESIAPARPASFEPLRGVVLQDWTDATMADLRTAAVRDMAKKYTIRIEDAAR